MSEMLFDLTRAVQMLQCSAVRFFALRALSSSITTAGLSPLIASLIVDRPFWSD